MSRLEVQGMVSMSSETVVRFRHIAEDGQTVEWEASVAGARALAQQIAEAAMNATYDAALVAFLKENWPQDWETMAPGLLAEVRQHRGDHWGDQA